MKLRVIDIFRSAIMINGDTLILKFNCMIHPNDAEATRKDLQAQCGEKIKVVILPDTVDVASDAL